MGKNWKWSVHLLWESFPSSLQDKIRSYIWDFLIGTVVAAAYFVWKAVMSIRNQPWEMIVLFGFGFFIVSVYASHRFREFLRHRSKYRLGGSRLPNGFISLHEAVDKLHKAAKQEKIPMMGAETMSGGTWDNPGHGSEEDIYTWWAIRVAKDDDIEMHGRRPPGDMERIGKRVKNDFIFVDKATRLRDPMNDDVYYTDLCVKRDALEASYYFSSGFHQG